MGHERRTDSLNMKFLLKFYYCEPNPKNKITAGKILIYRMKDNLSKLMSICKIKQSSYSKRKRSNQFRETINNVLTNWEQKLPERTDGSRPAAVIRL